LHANIVQSFRKGKSKKVVVFEYCQEPRLKTMLNQNQNLRSLSPILFSILIPVK